ncbi:MAG: TfuA-related McrA-glycine thioamidation protein [Tumebacillaceae bacterium]
MKQPIVFLGPSLRPDVAKQYLDARFEPPIKRGDLASLVAEGYDTFGIIDGEFFQNLSVSPKEILQYIKQGITFYGSSSMGALRASELYPFGMIGVGQVYRHYKSGLIRSDDDVALLFDSVRFRPLSEPLVNMRWAFYSAFKSGVITAAEYRLLIDQAKRTLYPERVYARVVRSTAGLPPERAEGLLSWIREQGQACDLKGLDAIALLKALRRRQQRKERNGSWHR